MSPRSRRELILATSERYLRSTREAKGRILTEFCAATGLHRKSAIRRLRHPPEEETKRSHARRSGRRRRYTASVRAILVLVWEAMGRPWSVRLKAALPLWLRSVRRRQVISGSIEDLLGAISPRTIDRLLASERRRSSRRLFGRTKPGTLLRREIPIQTAAWRTGSPGFTEMDLVSHSGADASGEFLHTLNVTDLETTWVESRAVLGKGETGVVAALDEISGELPFALRGVDSDNGSEFINHHLLAYCKKRRIAFTRSRPYKKDDNAHIEQKNWTHVRRILGWDRYDSLEALDAINDLYRNELRLMMNLFQPSVRLTGKQRLGARLVRRYDAPRTPLDRLVDNGKGNAVRVARLVKLRTAIDPFALSEAIDRKLTKLFELATRPSRGASSTSRRAVA